MITLPLKKAFFGALFPFFVASFPKSCVVVPSIIFIIPVFGVLFQNVRSLFPFPVALFQNMRYDTGECLSVSPRNFPKPT